MNSLGGTVGSGFGQYGSGVGSWGPWAGGTTPTDKYGIGSMVGDILLGMLFAKGGVAPGGFRAFAHGGIANKPTLGMIGEGKYNEAVVPLPDGKSIPVKGAGSNNNVTVNVAIDSDGKSKTETDGGGNAKELGYLVSQAVQSELVEQQRPGGLLSAY
jgi:phage-related minor tail protein